MRPLFLVSLAAGLFVWAGCLDDGTREEHVDGPRGGSSMHPLSAQHDGGYAAAPASTAPIGQPVFLDPAFAPASSTGAYCEVEDTSQASTMVPMTDPPILVDTAIYPAPGGAVRPLPQSTHVSGPVVLYSATPVQQQPIPPSNPDGRPATWAEKRMARGSPYDPVLRGTPYNYPAASAPVMAQPDPVVVRQPASMYVPQSAAPVMSEPAAVYQPAPQPVTVAQQYPQQQYQQPYQPEPAPGAPGTATVQYGSTVILPDPPMVIRDQSGRIETIGMSTNPTLPLVRVPSQYAPGASGAMVAAAPPLTYTIPPAPVSAEPVASGPAMTFAPNATYAAADLQLVPAPDVPPGDRPNDAAPSRWYEIIRPGNGPIRIGRVSSTCVCVSLRVPNRFVGAGERALIEARVVSPPQADGLTYGIYVAVLEPVSATLDADITLRLR